MNFWAVELSCKKIRVVVSIFPPGSDKCSEGDKKRTTHSADIMVSVIECLFFVNVFGKI